VSGRVDVLGGPEDDGSAAEAIAAALVEAGPPPDAILFEGTPSSSPWPEALAAAWPSGRRPRRRLLLSMPAPALELATGGYESWLASRSSHFRSRMRRGLRKLEELGGRIRVSTQEELMDDLSAFVELHAARWRPRGGSGVVSQGVVAMLPEVAAHLGANDRLRVWCIDLDGRTVSAQVFLAAGGEVSCWLGGFDERAPRMHPGPAILTLFKEIEHAHAAGERRIDLGGGSQPYKYEFAEQEDSLQWTALTFPTLRAPLARAALLPLTLRVSLARRTPARVKRLLRRARRLVPAR
jgi:CelD/BcsL family acetyltransferase involved in cellulose biosynthesis